MRSKALLVLVCSLAIVAGTSATLWGEATPKDIARLGADLTPLGAEKAGNAAGTIPAWDGGIKTPPAGYKPGGHLVDPYASDKVLFTITKDNVQQYAGNLTPGQQALLKTYPTYKMKVYPTHRSAA